MDTDLWSVKLSQAQFEKISQLVYQLCGINLHQGKEELVKARLMKRLRALGLGSFEQYLKYLKHDTTGQELALMIDALTTNKTSFFREPQHFDYLRRQIVPRLRMEGRKIRFWSAGCSSGEEPFSLAILLREEIPDIDRRDVRILATDISTRMLALARQAVYEENTLWDVPMPLLQKYFTPVRDKPPRTYRVNDNVRAIVRLARLNLIDAWPMKGPFDVIFCRNVMIYFDKDIRQQLIQRFYELLRPGGHLFVGHSESLTVLSHRLRYVQPAVYLK
ncbi:MAG: protein-glutamate O-methyltransferase [candidate division KSB1 bacterium]|nr:protein-glutamate O-methyltransferase [candidate division KSB1 bacterium]